MGECGCGEMRPYRVFNVSGNTLATEIYRGCEYCGTGIAFCLYYFTPNGISDFFNPEDEEVLIPDEFGNMVEFPIISKEDLIKSAKQMELDEAIGDKGYESVTDWLEDNGLEFLQRALNIRLTEDSKL
ncbi:hypothetical protein KC622_03610, partial [Candidatus Dojkabacteria bacterium]|nr:hypothetical protein [Candidatus Dojkabacteria bacterium]